MLYYDISDLMGYTHRHTRVSGIQRASTRTIARIAATLDDTQCRLIASHVDTEELATTDTGFFRRADFDPTAFNRFFSVTYIGPEGSPWSLAAAIRSTRLAHRLAETAHCLRRSLDPVVPEADRRAIWRRPRFAPGDVVYLPGIIGGTGRYIDALERAHHRVGLRVVTFVHDLIPLVAPRFALDPKTATFFETWLRRMSAICCRFLTCSHSTRRDLEDFFARTGLPPVPVTVIQHAHEFDGAPRVTTAVDAADRFAGDAVPARTPYVLCVGTREVRKNNLALVAAWQALLERHGPSIPHLVFAGRDGWKNGDFDAALAATDRLGGHVELVDRPSDAELADLYRGALFTVFPSHYEGWGLPIGESLWFGRPVVASRTSSMPEVGGDLVDYFDPEDPPTLERAIERMLDPDHRAGRIAAIAAAPLRTWNEVADRVLAALAEVVALPPDQLA